jgi:hypothetical protein
MRKDAFEQSVHIVKDYDSVFTFLSDLKNYPDIHPFLESVEDLELPTQEATLRPWHYNIVEKARVLGIPYRVKYTAGMSVDPTGEIISEAIVNSNIRVTSMIHCVPEDGGTRVDESITVEAPGWLFGHTFAQAKDAHTMKLVKLKEIME